MRILRHLILAIIALLVFSCSQTVAYAQNYTTNMTLNNLLGTGGSVSSAKVCAVAVDAYGNPLAFSAPTWGLVEPNTQFCGITSAGAITGGFNLPDACHTNQPSPIFYNVTIQPTSNGLPIGSTLQLNRTPIPNICGTTYPLDSYTPSTSIISPPSQIVATGISVPSSCTSPSILLATVASVTTGYVCSNGVYAAFGQAGGGGGGTVQPAPQAQLAGYTSAGTASTVGPGSTALNYVTPVLQSVINTDQFINGGGNNGVANAQASAQCANGCRLIQPSTSISTENTVAAIVKNNTFFTSLVGGVKYDYYFNAGLISAGQATAHVENCHWDYAFSTGSNYPGRFCNSQRLAGYAPGFYDTGQPTIFQNAVVFQTVTSRSISEIGEDVMTAHHVGDGIGHYNYYHFRGGTLWASDEGNYPFGDLAFEDGPPAGTILIGGANATVIKSNFTTNTSNQGDAGNLISTSEIGDTGTMVSTTGGSGYLLTSLTVNPTTHPAISTGYGVLASPCGADQVPSSPVNATCTITLTTGTFTLTTGNETVCVGDYTHPEQDRIVSVSAPSGGTQNIVIAEYYAHPAGAPVYEGGGCGQKLVLGYGSATPMAVNSGSVSGNYTTYFIAGSTSATTYDYIDLYKGGQNGQQPILVAGTPPGVGTIVPVTLSGLSATGGVITASGYPPVFFNNWTVPSAATLAISGSSNATLNGNCGAPIVINNLAGTFSCVIAGASGTAPSATLTLSGMNNYKTVCGAMTVGVINGSDAAPQGDGSLQVEANNCNWPVGATVAQPNFYNQEVKLSAATFYASTPPTSGPNTGHLTNLYGPGFSGAAHYEVTSSDPISVIQGYGGTQLGHTVTEVADNVAKVMHLIYAPVQDGCVICVDHDPLTPPGASQTSPQWTVWTIPESVAQVTPGGNIAVYGLPWYWQHQLQQGSPLGGGFILDTSYMVGGGTYVPTTAGTSTSNVPVCSTNTTMQLASCAALTGSITLTAAGADAITITGIGNGSHCSFSPTNATAAGLTSTTGAVWYSLAANTFTLNHATTTAAGATYGVLCSVN